MKNCNFLNLFLNNRINWKYFYLYILVEVVFFGGYFLVGIGNDFLGFVEFGKYLLIFG